MGGVEAGEVEETVTTILALELGFQRARLGKGRTCLGPNDAPGTREACGPSGIAGIVLGQSVGDVLRKPDIEPAALIGPQDVDVIHGRPCRNGKARTGCPGFSIW